MKRICKLLSVLVMVVMIMSTFSGCYWLSNVNANEVGIQLRKNAIENVVGAGKYSAGVFCTLENIDVSAKTITWNDPDLWTKDKQPVSFEITVTYSRKRDKDSVTNMWSNYNSAAKDDSALETLVRSRIPRVAKQITTSMTLDGMLGISSDESIDESTIGREKLQLEMFSLLEKELDEFNVDLLDVGVNNIAPDKTYAEMLTKKAVSKIAVELAQQDTLKLEEQVKQERAQTQVDLEIANRAKQVKQIENEIYTLNPQAYELERLSRLAGVIGSSDKIYFIPEGTDLNLILSGATNSTSIPVTTTTD